MLNYAAVFIFYFFNIQQDTDALFNSGQIENEGCFIYKDLIWAKLKRKKGDYDKQDN